MKKNFQQYFNKRLTRSEIEKIEELVKLEKGDLVGKSFKTLRQKMPVAAQKTASMKTQQMMSIDDLVTATRILVNENIIDGFGHVSIRDQNRPDRYFMTRDNLGWVDDDHIVELDLDSTLRKL